MLFPIFGVRALAVLLYFLLEPWQPSLDQMDILENDPVALSGRHLHGLLCHHLLPLSEGDVVEVLQRLRESQLFAERLNDGNVRNWLPMCQCPINFPKLPISN